MKVIIKKGHHYPRLINRLNFPIMFKKDNGYMMSRVVTFTPDSLYDLKNANNLDTNKLYGFCPHILPTKEYLIPHHNDSFRWGWRVSKDLKTIELLPYTHIGDLTYWGFGREIELNKEYLLDIAYDKDMIYYYIDYVCVFSREYKREEKYIVGYELGAYFGGNEVAPNDISFYVV